MGFDILTRESVPHSLSDRDASSSRPQKLQKMLTLRPHVRSSNVVSASHLRTCVLVPARQRVSLRRVSVAAKKSVGDLSEADLKGKVVFERADLNVPLDKTLNITDDTRIRAAIPTLEYLTSKGAKVLLSSHLVRKITHDHSAG